MFREKSLQEHNSNSLKWIWKKRKEIKEKCHWFVYEKLLLLLVIGSDFEEQARIKIVYKVFI